jgi:hypothetical protein
MGGDDPASGSERELMHLSRSGEPENDSPHNNGHRRKVTAEKATIIAALIGLMGALITVLVPRFFQSDEAKSPTQETPSEPTRTASGALSALEVTDVSASVRGAERVFLDLKIRNIGDKTSILKRSTVHVSDWRKIDRCHFGAPLPVSSRYKITLPADPQKSKFDVSTAMNDFLKPNEATRVRIEVGLNEKDPFIDGIIFRFTLELDFDAHGQARSDPLVISLPGKVSPPQVWKEMQSDPEVQECAESNLRNLRYILGLPGRRIPDLDDVADAL